MKDELSDNEHLEMLNNPEAELLGRISAFEKYVELDFEADKALSMAGLTENDIHRNPFLRIYYINAKRKIDPNYKHKTHKV
jgi:hypothetical protein